MSTEKTKDEINQHKKQAIKKINGLLNSYIFSDNHALQKKADLISYWLESFSNYISFEEKFEPSRLIRYSRGNVIRVNFGFNIGKEFGGLHFAVVIDNDNKRNADVLTVVPLSSSDGKEVHERNVDLGTELYEKINAVQQNLLSTAMNDLEELSKIEASITAAVGYLKENDPSKPPMPEGALVQFESTLREKLDVANKKANLEKSIEVIKRNTKEIAKLKTGSMAVTNQITTVSKQRIYTPKRSEDFLYGISLSASAMEKINEKLRQLYIFS